MKPDQTAPKSDLGSKCLQCMSPMAYYIYCIYSNALQTTFYHESKYNETWLDCSKAHRVCYVGYQRKSIRWASRRQMLCVNQSIVTLILQVDSVRSQCNDRINKLTSEVHALEMVSILVSINNVVLEKVNEYDQEMPQPHSADQTHGTVRKKQSQDSSLSSPTRWLQN